MKKLALTFAIIIGMSLGAFAQEGGLFGKGPARGEDSYITRENGSLLNLPNSHGDNNDQPAPLTGGALLFIGFGAAYALKKKRSKK